MPPPSPKTKPLTTKQKISRLSTKISAQTAHASVIAGVPYTTGEKVVQVVLKAFVEEIVKAGLTVEDLSAYNVVDKLPLSDSTIAHRVEEISCAIEDEVLNEIKQSVTGFAL